MHLLLVLMMISTGCSHKVVDSTEDLSPEHFNSSTLLHPVARVTSTKNTDDKAFSASASSWKLTTSLADADHEHAADNVTTSKERPDYITSTGIIDSPTEEPTTSKPDNASSSEFRASPQLGSFLGEDNYVVPTPTLQTYGPFSPVIKRPPPPHFISPYKEVRWSPFNKIPKEMFKHHWDPLRMETPLLMPAKHHAIWRPSSFQDSKPTAEAPVTSLPAGTAYHSADSFKHKPEEFGMDFHGDLRDIAIKKPPQPPWSGMMRMLAALVPVGIIVSALTPSVLQIETTANNNGVSKPNNNIFRRADHYVNTNEVTSQPSSIHAAGGGSNLHGPSLPVSGSDHNLHGPNLPAMSERCRRRLLCELQADHNYQRSSAASMDCRRVRCEDPSALHAALGRLLHTNSHKLSYTHRLLK